MRSMNVDAFVVLVFVGLIGGPLYILSNRVRRHRADPAPGVPAA